MSKKSKRKRKKRQSVKRKQNSIVATHPKEASSDDIDYEKKVLSLREQIAKTPNDDLKRELSICLARLEKYQDSVSAILDIQVKTHHDLIQLGANYILLQQWDNAIQILEEARSFDEANGETYYFLAIAQTKGCKDSDIATEGKILIQQLLSQAITMANCPLEAFLWLDDLQFRTKESVNNQVETLQQALANYPDSEEVRWRLANKFLYQLSEPKKAIEVISPILLRDNLAPKIAWIAFEASYDEGDLITALQYLALLNMELEDQIQLAKVKGDVLLELKRFDEAIGCYENLLQSNVIDTRITGLFSKAYAKLKNNKLSEALQDVIAWVDAFFIEFFDNDKEPQPDYLIFGDIRNQQYFWDHVGNPCCEKVCLDLLEKEKNEHTLPIDPELRSKINYLLYRLHHYESDYDTTLLSNWLLNASEFIDHPKLSYDLSEYYYQEGNIFLAIQHHLDYYIWRYKTREGTMPFSYYSLSYHESERPVIRKREHNKIHKLILKYLKSCQDTGMVESVFVPFYHNFWRTVLVDGQMYKEIIEFARIFLESIPESDNALFDYALGHHQIGQTDEAEKAYRQYLERWSDAPAVLHNLACLLKDKGLLQDALEFSDEAVLLDPDNELHSRINDEIRQDLEQQQIEQRKREDFLKTAPERWPQLDGYKRKLLATLTVIDSFDNWSHLSELSGIEEKYLRGHWRKLVERGMIIETNEGKYEVNKHILPFIERERSHALTLKVIHADSTIAYKPIFDHKQEYTIYKLLLEQFPNHLVFPNTALSAIFQYDGMKELLSYEEFQYFLMSRVDFCIVSTANYLPIIAFEIDSHYHDIPKQIERDQKKNRIFQVGGVPLLRLRAFGKPTEQTMRRQIFDTVQKFLAQLSLKTVQKGIYNTLTQEISFEDFGLPALEQE
jgi:tetratricopeptide (TPR) repeat protein